MRAAFVYANPRGDLLRAIEHGEEPDSALYGLRQLPSYGIPAYLRDPVLSRVTWRPPLDRLAWNAREVIAPFEIRDADVVVTSLAALFPAVARARRLPVVLLNFGLNLIWRRASPARRALMRMSLSSAARIVCLGRAQRDEFLQFTGLDEERVVTLLVPIDATFFQPALEEPQAGIVAVGKDLARDYGTFAAAVREIDAAATVVAHPRNLEGVTLPETATVSSWLPSTALRDLYGRAACVVVSQHAPGYPFGSEAGGLTALLEAMAMGKAIVATDRPVIRDYVDDDVEALLVPPEDPAAMRDAIERILSDDDLTARLGGAARARVERDHTSDVFASRLAPVLRSVV
jgi:glycosyltransferase involved in cell wall biosynthesis